MRAFCSPFLYLDYSISKYLTFVKYFDKEI
nr:MAG TPA: hypothetical protein [Caudoviricetes sp.]DAP69083.1 MAG TPA: hypothetical protein [Caudoviricetes sp.]DAX45134.1 MAG TPA: hypothetical protein [Caudoviricetes sp.]